MRFSSKLVRISAAAGAFVLAGTGLLAYQLTRTPTKVSVNQAVSRFRQSHADHGDGVTLYPLSQPQSSPFASRPLAEGATAGRTKPAEQLTARPATRKSAEEGVYVYDTRGYESTDALTGSRHDYPNLTTVTLTRTRCGFNLRWLPLDQRWEESRFCSHPRGTELRQFITYHEFFNKGDVQQFDCPEASLVFAFPYVAGESWKFRCSSASGDFVSSVKVVGEERVDVGGRPVDAVHLIYDADLSGRNRGTQKQERWISIDNDFVVRMLSDASMTTDSAFGAVKYEEHYELKLNSLTPRQ